MKHLEQQEDVGTSKRVCAGLGISDYLPSQAESSQLGLPFGEEAPADSSWAHDVLGDFDPFQTHQSTFCTSLENSFQSSRERDDVQSLHHSADPGAGSDIYIPAAEQLQMPRQSSFPAEEFTQQGEISEVCSTNFPTVHDDALSRDISDGCLELAGREGKSLEDRMCFGMIDTASLRVSSSTALDMIPPGRFEVILKDQGPATTVYDLKSNGYIGFLDLKTARSIESLCRKCDIVTRIYALAPPKSDSKKASVPCGLTLPIYITMYGHMEVFDALGEALAEEDVYLQHPSDRQDLALYKNPQYLLRPGQEFPKIKYGDAEFTVLDNDESINPSSLGDGHLERIFKTAQGPEDFFGMEQSPRLKTSLQRHQKVALAMMIEKESGNLEGNEFPALWSPKVTRSGSMCSNIVTGAVYENPALCLGGLLADEMGLGKTLSIIALISSSLDTMARLAVGEPFSGALDPVKEYNKVTLIVTPKSTLHSWKEQFDKHTVGSSIRIFFYRGNKRNPKAPSLESHDVVITTYGTLTAESNRKAKHSCDEDQPLLSHRWYRVVLDEAHIIRNTSTKQCATACSLKARHRWCLTGTPIQNRIEDFGALLQFLQVYPFNNPSFFMHEIAEWIKCGHEMGMKRLHQLVSAVCLRRTKECLGLPPRTNKTQHVPLNSQEIQLYEYCRRNSVEFIESAFREDGRLKSPATAILQILRLRQVCDHGKQMLSSDALKNMEDYTSSHGSIGTMPPSAEMASCGLCRIKVHEYKSLLACLHPACRRCSEEMEIDIEPECSICAETDLQKVDPAYDPEFRSQSDIHYQPSSKVTALLRNLERDQRGSIDKPLKSVVFSYWTKMLVLIGHALTANGIRFELLNGKMSTPQRHKAIERFRNEPSCTVLLATIGSAGVGIDLTAACRVHLMEPQWNPMVEEQALDRVHRIGQNRPVTAIRYIVKGSIEEYVISLQKKKLDLIQNSLRPDASPKAITFKEKLKDLYDFLTLSSPRAS